MRQFYKACVGRQRGLQFSTTEDECICTASWYKKTVMYNSLVTYKNPEKHGPRRAVKEMHYRYT